MHPTPDPGLFHLAPWLLIGVAYAIAVFQQETGESPRLKGSLLLILSGHLAIAVLNTSHQLFRAANPDSIHPLMDMATSWAQTGSFPYFQLEISFFGVLMGLPFQILGSSIFLGNVLTVIASLLATLLFLRLFRTLLRHPAPAGVLWLFAGLPPSLVWMSITLRESFELLFFLFACTQFLALHQTRETKYFFSGTLGLTALGLLHQGLLLFSFFFLISFVLWTLLHDRFHPRFLFFFLPALGMFLLIFFLYPISPLTLLSGKTIPIINYYRGQITAFPTPANYGGFIDDSSSAAALLSSLRLWLKFMFGPFLWEASTPSLFYGFLEALLRLFFFGGMTYNLFRSGPMARSVRLFFFVQYLVLTCMWALGTGNYGTALRHHLVQNWILLLFGYPFGILQNHLENTGHHQ